MTTKIISVHVPKCAGTSFLHAMIDEFGEQRVYLDYADRPVDPASPMNLDPDGFRERMSKRDLGFLAGKKVIHGHFHMSKYARFKTAYRVTFLRDPIERLISHYYFWLDWQPRVPHRLHTYFINQKLSLRQFAQLPNIRRLLSSIYFSNLVMATFDFVGFYDKLDYDFAHLTTQLGIKADLGFGKVNHDNDYRTNREKILADKRLTNELRDIMKDDVSFYERLRYKRP